MDFNEVKNLYADFTKLKKKHWLINIALE